MTVKDFIAYLQTVDQEAEVQIFADDGDSYNENYKWRDFDPNIHAYYKDFRGNEFAKGQHYENKRYLELGG